MCVEPSGQGEETDVVVIGTGSGGMSAIGSAVTAHAQVVSIEAHDNIGGNRVLSTGWVAFVDSVLQREQGIKDSGDLFLKDCEKLITIYGLMWDRNISRLFARESSKIYDILTERSQIHTAHQATTSDKCGSTCSCGRYGDVPSSFRSRFCSAECQNAPEMFNSSAGR
jgi:succinate dehydrogenase/fumarate reductase flavoprotein subunit